MIIEDKGILLCLRKHQESGYIVDCLLENHGLVRGYTRLSKRTNFNCGNIVKVVWKARLNSQLGSITIENEKCVSHTVAFERLKNLTLSSAVTLATQILHERENSPSIYERFIHFILSLDFGNQMYLRNYALLELELLSQSGYGLELSKCAATNATTKLAYVSPKSGCAISLDAGLPYHSRLFILPKFILDQTASNTLNDILNCLQVTAHFYNKHIWNQNFIAEPATRRQLYSCLSELILDTNDEGKPIKHSA